MGAVAESDRRLQVKEVSTSDRVFERFIQILCLFWFLSLFLGWVEKEILHWPGGDWYPFFRLNPLFDFEIYYGRFKYFHDATFFQLAGFPFTYPAPAAIAFDGFFQLGSHALEAYFFFCFLAFAGGGLFLGRAIIHRGLAVSQTIALIGLSFLLSYPFWFLIQRANIEMVNWLFVAFGVTAYWNKRWYIAALFIGVAASVKIFPFVLLGLLLSARKYRAVAFGIAVCIFSTVASTWFVGPTYRVASAGIAKGLAFFRLNYMLQVHPLEIGYDHSIFALIKELAFRHRAPELYYVPWLNGYMLVAASAGLILYFWKIRTLPRANQILALTVAAILLPPASADYTLVHLYVPWAVLVLVVVSLKDGRKVKGLVFCFICMAFLMAPESFAMIQGIRIAGQLKAIVLLILFIVSMTCPFEEPAPDSADGVGQARRVGQRDLYAERFAAGSSQ
jgi:hypothetical protein